jgi:hypothetical protein
VAASAVQSQDVFRAQRAARPENLHAWRGELAQQSRFSALMRNICEEKAMPPFVELEDATNYLIAQLAKTPTAAAGQAVERQHRAHGSDCKISSVGDHPVSSVEDHLIS